jgi:hypothetical protein
MDKSSAVKPAPLATAKESNGFKTHETTKKQTLPPDMLKDR